MKLRFLDSISKETIVPNQSKGLIQIGLQKMKTSAFIAHQMALNLYIFLCS